MISVLFKHLIQGFLPSCLSFKSELNVCALGLPIARVCQIAYLDTNPLNDI